MDKELDKAAEKLYREGKIKDTVSFKAGASYQSSRMFSLEEVKAIASNAWDCGIERFCFDNGSEFVEGTPMSKNKFIDSIDINKIKDDKS